MAKRVFVTGGSGFVGRAVIEELLGRGIEVAALVTAAGSATWPAPRDGDPRRPVRRRRARRGHRRRDAVIHLVGIIMEKPSAGVTFERDPRRGHAARASTRRSERACGDTSTCPRWARGPTPPARITRPSTPPRNSSARSGLDWTILRPSMIHGPRGEFMRMEVRWAKRRADAVPVHALLRRRRRWASAARASCSRSTSATSPARSSTRWRTRRRSASPTTSPARTCSPGRSCTARSSQAVVGQAPARDADPRVVRVAARRASCPARSYHSTATR